MAGMLISGDKSFISFAEGTILVVAVAVFASLTVLPAMLSWLGDRVEKGRVPILGNRRRGVGESRFWSSVTGAVMRRPGISLLLAGGLLVALAIPALGMKSVNSDIDELPGDLPVIQTYNKVKKIFPAEGVTATVVMEVDDVTAGGPTTGIAALIEQGRRLAQAVQAGHGAHREQGRDRRADQHPDDRQRNRPGVARRAEQAPRRHRARHGGRGRGSDGQRDRKRCAVGGLREQPRTVGCR